MKSLVLLILTVFAFSSYADSTLPDYGEENLITDKEEKLLFFEALASDLKLQNLDSCKEGDKWNFVSYVLANKGKTELYKLESNSPLFVVRYFRTSNDPDVVDFRVFTNPEMTVIEKVEHTNYSVISKRVNVGTLANPVFENKKVATVDLEADCYIR